MLIIEWCVPKHELEASLTSIHGFAAMSDRSSDLRTNSGKMYYYEPVIT